jgi:hypothetical protein
MGAVAIADKQELPDVGHLVKQGSRAVLAKVTMSASYATNGDTVSLATLGLTRVTAMFVVAGGSQIRGRLVAAPAGAGARLELAGTEVAPKIKATAGGGTPAEIANATNLSTTVVYVLFVGE